MIKLTEIYTIRGTPQPYYWDIVFDWEDQFSTTLGIPLVPAHDQYAKMYTPGPARKVLNRLNYYQWRDRRDSPGSGYRLAFHIGPPGVYSFYTGKKIIPIIIDFWKGEDLRRFEKIFALAPVVFVSSMEVLAYLMGKVSLNLQHLSLSLPDKYLAETDSAARPIDVIQLGRQNAMLSDFMKQYLIEFPNLRYVYAEIHDGQLTMVSTKGDHPGVLKERNAFMQLLRQSKVSLLSAPGLDKDSVRTGGFSPVTPRFLESAACGCRMVGVYPENEDFQYNRIREICSSVTTYDSFREAMNRQLAATVPPDYHEYLQRNLSSVKATELREKLSRI